MCVRCKTKSDKSFCDPCVLDLERFDLSYRGKVRLDTVEGFKAAIKEGMYVSKRF